MKPYPKYKDSGVEWIGEVPEGWEIIRTRYVFNFLSGNGFPHHFQGKTEGNYPFYKVSDINLNGINVSLANNYVTRADVEKNGWTIIPEKSILLAKIGEALKKNHRKINASECLIDNNMLALIGKNNYYHISYLYYLMLLIDMVWFINPGAVPSIDLNKLRDFFVAIPEKAEQKFITAYLNRKTTQIDNLISKKQKLIELLKEERSAIINQAVTKGLNPDAPMKDSGIEWLGEVPEHWEIERLKYIIRVRSGDGITNEAMNQDGKYEVYGGNGFIGSSYKFNVKSDSIIIGRVGAKCGNVRYLKGEKWISDNALILKSDQDYTYLKYLLEFLNLNHLANQNAQPLITSSMVKLVVVTLPNSLEEQKLIANFINAKTKAIDQTISNIENQIDLLQEYRITLIFEVVTGKIDVRT